MVNTQAILLIIAIIILYHIFELYSINIFLNNNKYFDVIQILEKLEFNYTHRIGINDIVKKN